jgi:squalene synthase HpnC
VRKERLELSRLSAPAPKAGASTNSATFATDLAKHVIIAEKSLSYHVRALFSLRQALISVPVAHYENFPVASWLAPPAIRPAIVSIYAFARSADDIADEGSDPAAERLARLDAYASALDRIANGEIPDDPLFAPLGAAIRRHSLPLDAFHALLSAFRQDVMKSRYRDFAELADYCSRSANPIGRLLLHLYEISGSEPFRQADSICTGLQLANFWQDIAVDWRKGRVYLPQDDMARFGVSETDIAAGVCDKRWEQLVGFEVDRARSLLESGQYLAQVLPLRLKLELRMVVSGGLRILAAIDGVRGDVFRRRPVLRRRDWSAMAVSAIFNA